MDIDQLSRQADKAVLAADRSRGQPGPAAARERRIKKVIGIFALLLPLLVLQVHFAWIERLIAHVFPARALAHSQADMKAVLGAAREAVESVRLRLGALPEALPGAALAALVQYERSGDTYSLSMSDGHSVATMDGNGLVGFQRVPR